MWAAQTYLGAYVSKAKYFIYLMYQDYVDAENTFQNTVIENLRKLGRKTGSDSAIFVPDDSAHDLIKRELQSVFTEELMWKIAGQTPGLMFTDKNLSELDPLNDRWVFLSLRPYMEDKRSDLSIFFQQIEQTIQRSDDLLKDISGSKWESFWSVIKDTVMLEPNLSGIGFDFRAVRRKFIIKNNLD